MDKTMAERFVRYYNDWLNITPDQHELNGDTFTDFSEYARTRSEVDGADLTYIQWWNCRPCTEEQGAPIPNTISAFAAIEFDDGSYAFSPRKAGEPRRWLLGVPS